MPCDNVDIFTRMTTSLVASTGCATPYPTVTAESASDTSVVTLLMAAANPRHRVDIWNKLFCPIIVNFKLAQSTVLLNLDFYLVILTFF